MAEYPTFLRVQDKAVNAQIIIEFDEM